MSMTCDVYAVPEESARQVIANPSGIRGLLEALDRSRSGISLEKSWHGLHFAFTGSAWDGEPPLDFLASGGDPIGTEDVGYGPARVLMPDTVARVNSALDAMSDEEFARRFDPEALSNAEIYPQIWDEPLED
jgi:hypothetical protein